MTGESVHEICGEHLSWPTDCQLAWLHDQGVPTETLVCAGGIWVADVITDDFGRFEITEDGLGHFKALVLGAFTQSWAERKQGPWDLPECLDLVAFNPREPTKFYRRRGSAEFLGEWNVYYARNPWPGVNSDTDGVLRLYQTPLDWLRAGCDGAVVLEPVLGMGVSAESDKLLRDLLWGIERIVCDDDVHASLVFSCLRRRHPPLPLPEVYVHSVEADFPGVVEPSNGQEALGPL